jgi:WS/DGAT/MGAT family acyltransferase
MTTHVRLSFQDSIFLRAETRATPMHVGGLQIYRIPRGAPAHFVAQLYKSMRAFPVSVPPLNYRLTPGLAGKVMPSWEEMEDVDLDYHFRRSALPHPGGERELGMLVSRLHSTAMDLSRPLWEFHLIEGLEGGRFAFYTKLHHAMVDGAAGMRLVHPATDPKASDVPPFWADESLQPQGTAPATAGPFSRLPLAIGEEIKSLPGLMRSLATTAQTALGVGSEHDLASIAEAPRTLFNVHIGGQRRVATYATRLDRLKAIGRAAGGTVNDVVLAATRCRSMRWSRPCQWHCTIRKAPRPATPSPACSHDSAPTPRTFRSAWRRSAARPWQERRSSSR